MSRKGKIPHVDKRSAIGRHLLLSTSFMALFLFLNLPKVIGISGLGTVVWYPATGLGLVLMLAVSPWYFLLASICGALAGILIYQQPLLSFSGTVGVFCFSGLYAAAAILLRGTATNRSGHAPSKRRCPVRCGHHIGGIRVGPDWFLVSGSRSRYSPGASTGTRHYHGFWAIKSACLP